RADEVVRFDLAIQVESFADTACHLRLAGVFRCKGGDVGLNVPGVASIGGSRAPGNVIYAGAGPIEGECWGLGDGRDFPRGAPGYEREGLGDVGRNGEVNRASMWAINAWLDLCSSRVVGPAAVAEGRVVEGHHIASHPRGRMGITRADDRHAGSRQCTLDHG